MPFLFGCLSSKQSIRWSLYIYLLLYQPAILCTYILISSFACTWAKLPAIIHLSVTSYPALLFTSACIHAASPLHSLWVNLCNCLSVYHLIISLPLYPVLAFLTLQRLFHNPLLHIFFISLSYLPSNPLYDSFWLYSRYWWRLIRWLIYEKRSPNSWISLI